MFESIEWAEYAGAGVTAIASDYVASGKLSFLKTVTDLDYYFEGAVIAADLFLADKMKGAFGDGLDGAAVYAAGDLVGKLFNKYVVNKATASGSGTTSASGTAASVDYRLAPVAAPVQSFPQSSLSFAQDY